MPFKVKLYVGSIITIGAAILAATSVQWHSSNLTTYMVLLLVTLVAAGLKVRLPGITGTYSPTFLFLLAGMSVLTLSELVLLAGASAIVQSLWRATERPSAAQVLFNTAVLVISTAFGCLVNRAAGADGPQNGDPAILALVAAVFWVSNTGFVAGVLVLISQGTLRDIWQHWSVCTFPYYLIGAAMAGMVRSHLQQGNWLYAFYVMPMIVLTYIAWRLWVDRQDSPGASHT